MFCNLGTQIVNVRVKHRHKSVPFPIHEVIYFKNESDILLLMLFKLEIQSKRNKEQII